MNPLVERALKVFLDNSSLGGANPATGDAIAGMVAAYIEQVVAEGQLTNVGDIIEEATDRADAEIDERLAQSADEDDEEDGHVRPLTPEEATVWLREILDDCRMPVRLDGVQAALGAGATIDPDLLIEACQRGDDGLALLLMEYGADPQWKRARGCWSAFTHARRNRQHMPLTWAAMTRQELAQKAAAKRSSRAWASGVALPARSKL